MNPELQAKYGNPEATMKFLVRLLRIIGLKDGSHRSVRFRCGWLFGVFVVLNVVPYCIGGYPDLDRYVEGTIELCFNFNMYGSGMLFACKEIEFRDCIDEMKKLATLVYLHSPRLARELTHHNHRMDRFTKAWTTFMVSVALFYWIAPLPGIYWTYFTRTNESEPLGLVQHFEVQFYWLDNRNSIRDYTIFAAMMLPFIFLCATMNNIKILTVSCSVQYCTKFMYLVTEAIRQLDSLSTNDDLARELRKVVAMHKRVLICSRLLDESLRPLLLMQWLLCITIWSVALVYFDYSGIHMKSISIITMFLLVTAEMLSYCILGTRLTGQAEQLERAIYASRWYNLPIREQRNVQIMLKRAQRQLGMRGYKFVDVNLEEFSRMVNRAYSAYVVLKREISA